MTAPEVLEALAKYDAEVALCPVRQNDARSAVKCRKCGATQVERCGQDNPYPVIEALRQAARQSRGGGGNADRKEVGNV